MLGTGLSRVVHGNAERNELGGSSDRAKSRPNNADCVGILRKQGRRRGAKRQAKSSRLSRTHDRATMVRRKKNELAVLLRFRGWLRCDARSVMDALASITEMRVNPHRREGGAHRPLSPRGLRSVPDNRCFLSDDCPLTLSASLVSRLL